MDKLPKLPDPPAPVVEPVTASKAEVFVTPPEPTAVDATVTPPPAEQKPPEKKKRQMTTKQLEHLQRMREKARATRKAKLAEKMPNQTVPPKDAPTSVPFDIQNQTPPPSPPYHAQPLQRQPQAPPVQQPQYVYHMQQPDMNNYVRKEDMANIVQNALDTQHKRIMAEATRIRQEQEPKRS